MHMLLRTLWGFLLKPFLKPRAPGEAHKISMRVWPTDIDVLWHVNNGMYFSYMDFGRWDMIFRNGLYGRVIKAGMYTVVAGEMIRFKRSIGLWKKFDLVTEPLGHDDKYFFMRQKFFVKGELMAVGLVKVRFVRRKGGSVPSSDILKLFPENLQSQPINLGDRWYGLESEFF